MSPKIDIVFSINWDLLVVLDRRHRLRNTMRPREDGAGMGQDKSCRKRVQGRGVVIGIQHTGCRVINRGRSWMMMSLSQNNT